MTEEVEVISGEKAGATESTSDLPQYCDLVMKGGITSGVIYPKLVSKLSGHYKFKNIGGTSAGAIASGACAAAEYGRAHGNSTAFEKLDDLPAILGEEIAAQGRSKLFTLFQPTEPLKRHFGVLVGTLNKMPADAIRSAVSAMLAMHPFIVAGCLLLATLLLSALAQAQAHEIGWVTAFAVGAVAVLVITIEIAVVGYIAVRGPTTTAVSIFLAVAVMAAVMRFWFRVEWSWHLVGIAVAMQIVGLLVIALLMAIVVIKFASTLLTGLHENGYGICSGRTESTDGKDVPGLTDWLTGYLNELAGLPPQGPPLTFQHLWGTDDFRAKRIINLEVMTSAVSQQMAYAIPFRDGTPGFYYDPEQWAKLFPPNVMAWLANAQAANPDGDSSDPMPKGALVIDQAGKVLRALPRRADLPVVVAVRMSLSFPILLSAIPLYQVDFSRTEVQRAKASLVAAKATKRDITAEIVATKVWFSDGGIGSNIPLHMFDSLLPGHPTFAVNLKPEHPDNTIKDPLRADNKGGRIYLPERKSDGRLRFWSEPSDAHAAAGLAGFLVSIVNTMQNWRDELLFPYPGFRDRIVQISQRTSEGGLNLDMPAGSIAALGSAGAMAAERLIDRFHPSGAQKGQGWADHQTSRLGTFLGVMQPGCIALQPLLASGAWASRVYDIKSYTGTDHRAATDFLNSLEKLGSDALKSGSSLDRRAPKPLAQIRIMPKI